jgi:hypothetical protein
LEQPPRYHATQQYSTYPSYGGDMSRVYQSQTPPLPPPHAKYDYRYNQQLSALPGPQVPFSNGTPADRDYAEHYKKRKLSSDISVYSLSAQNGAGEDEARGEGYSRNTATPNISTPSSTERPSVELQSTRARSNMTEQDKHELKKEKNREKQRRLRSRRAEQLNNLEHLNTEKDARLEHLEAKVKRLEMEAIQKDEKWQRWVLELESRLGHSRRRSRLLENASSGSRENDDEINNSISREIADIRIRFGVAPFEGMARPNFSGSTESMNDGRIDDNMSGMFHANVGMPSTEEQRPREAPSSTSTASAISAPQKYHLANGERYRQSESPLSMQGLLSSNQRDMPDLSSRGADVAKDNTAIVTPVDDARSPRELQTAIYDRAEQLAESMGQGELICDVSKEHLLT